MDGSSGGAGKHQKKRKRGRRRPGRHPKRKNLASNIKHIEHSLAAAIREAYGEMFGPRTENAHPFTLGLKVHIEPGNPWRLAGSPSLENQIRGAVREMASQAEAFQPGRVYCYRCDSAHCPHGIPPRPTAVFGGYTSTGLPLWPELSQVLLDIRHPKVDLLFEPSQQGLAVVYMNPEMLKQQQLNVFGKQSKTYDILGQVVFGFLRMRSCEADIRETEREGFSRTEREGFSRTERVAFTVQAVESRRIDGSPRLELNVLGRLANGSYAMDAVNGPYQIRISAIIAAARRRIDSLNPSSPGPGKGRPARLSADTAQQVTDSLRKLSRTLEKLGRQRGRRTVHAEGHRITERPITNALKDTHEAPDNLILWDEHRHTIVVIGPRNRVHVFSPQGRHITSILLESEAIKSRMRRKRWVLLSGEPLKQFRAAVSHSS